jgi:LPS-assembly lipoprotein
LLVTFSLIDRAAERVIYEGRARSVAAYNVVAADYATLTAERDAQARAARLVSREIETSLAVFFNRRRRG